MQKFIEFLIHEKANDVDNIFNFNKEKYII